MNIIPTERSPHTPPKNKLNLFKVCFMEKPVRVTDHVYIDALPHDWELYEQPMPQATPYTRWLRRIVRENVPHGGLELGFEYLTMPGTGVGSVAVKYYETELWYTTTAKARPDPHSKTPTGRRVWRRHFTVQQMKKPNLP